MTVGVPGLSIFHPLKAIFIVSLTLAVSACQTTPPPDQPPVEPAPETTAPPVSGTGADPVEQPPAEEPEPPAALCPEPEPAPEPVCPPPPKPKPCPVCPPNPVEDKMLLGAVEKVRLEPPGVIYSARIDTGAEGSSIHATNIIRFERDGEKWVRFELDFDEEDPVVMERKVERRVLVRQASVDEVERRVKILMNMTLGSYTDLVEFSLNDRSDMEYPVLIGRNVLRNNAVVDVSREFIAK